MKRLSLFFALVILLAGCAVGPTATPSDAQGYGGYNYPPPPQNPYATPWVGSNTPWTFYQGDWFLKGVLYQFFGNQYGWAPYYSYPPTYIVRPQVWYAPQWNAWYQRNPHYWTNFQRQYPYWRGHRVGQHYDQNFYNKYHRGQGQGWQKGYHVSHQATPTGPGVRPGQPAGPSVHQGQPTAPGVRPGQPAGPSVRPGQPAGPGVHPGQPTAPSVHPAQPAGPSVRPAQPASPSVRPSQPTGPSVRPGQPTGTGGRAPVAPATGERKPQKPTRGEEKPQ
jgi:hypothetical protein